jgi:hypothetical protein
MIEFIVFAENNDYSETSAACQILLLFISQYTSNNVAENGWQG